MIFLFLDTFPVAYRRQKGLCISQLGVDRMGFGRRNQEEIVTEETKVWVCKSENCNAWVRDNFKSSEIPTCPICKSEMEQTTKVLEVINNPGKHF